MGRRRADICKYNNWILCTFEECNICGWNPTVDEERRAEIRDRLQDKQYTSTPYAGYIAGAGKKKGNIRL